MRATSPIRPRAAQCTARAYWDGPVTPLYPFGFGLSYTTLLDHQPDDYSPASEGGKLGGRDSDVTNTGTVTGDEVVQLYIHQKAGSDSRPIRELKGFRRLTLQPGETKTVTFLLGPDELGYWSTNSGKWLQDTEAFDIWVGAELAGDAARGPGGDPLRGGSV